MAYNEGIAQRLRGAMSDIPNVIEKRMFGGITFMVRGHMCCGVVGSELMLRVGADGYEDALKLPYTRKMDFTGRPLTGFVFVSENGFESDEDLSLWIKRAHNFIKTLPEK